MWTDPAAGLANASPVEARARTFTYLLMSAINRFPLH